MWAGWLKTAAPSGRHLLCRKGLSMLLTEDRLVQAMRSFVIATNRVENIVAKGDPDLRVLEQATEERLEAAIALQQALQDHGWRRSGAR